MHRKWFLTILFLLFALPAWAGMPIYCPHCLRHILDYKYDEINPGDKITLDDLILVESQVVIGPVEYATCPFDDAPLNGFLYWAWEKKMHEPTLNYPAVTFLTKDNEGNLVWKPYELNLDD